MEANNKPPSHYKSIVCFGEQFTEEDIIPFLVLKLTRLPDGEDYYLLQSPGLNRLLLPFAIYQSCGIAPGKKLECRIDKINCSGRIFLEPIFTTFQVGKRYGFKVVNIHKRTDRKRRQKLYYQLLDQEGKIHNALLDTNIELSPGSCIEGRFERTRKGKLILSNAEVINIC